MTIGSDWFVFEQVNMKLTSSWKILKGWFNAVFDLQKTSNEKEEREGQAEGNLYLERERILTSL